MFGFSFLSSHPMSCFLLSDLLFPILIVHPFCIFTLFIFSWPINPDQKMGPLAHSSLTKLWPRSGHMGSCSAQHRQYSHFACLHPLLAHNRLSCYFALDELYYIICFNFFIFNLLYLNNRYIVSDIKIQGSKDPKHNHTGPQTHHRAARAAPVQHAKRLKGYKDVTLAEK